MNSMAPPMTAQRVASWIIHHEHRERVLPGWSCEQISMYVTNTILNQDLYILTGPDEDIVATMVYVVREPPKKEIFVDFILSSTPFCLPIFVKFWSQRYADYTVVAKRQRGISRKYTLKNFKKYLRIFANATTTFTYA